MNNQSWPLSKILLLNILSDRISDCFAAELVWDRLGYKPNHFKDGVWEAGPLTPLEWRKEFPYAPQVITQRHASVKLTRSIPAKYKQLVKENLDFHGYKIGELYPRRTRRATIVNWLLAWLAQNGEELPLDGPLPTLLKPPQNPVKGHLGDPEIE